MQAKEELESLKQPKEEEEEEEEVIDVEFDPTNMVISTICEGILKESEMVEKFEKAVGKGMHNTTCIAAKLCDRLQQSSKKELASVLLQLFSRESFLYQRVNWYLRNDKTISDALLGYYLFLQLVILSTMGQTAQLVKKYWEERMKMTAIEEKNYLLQNFSIINVFEEIKIEEEIKKKRELEQRIAEEGIDPEQAANE